MKKKAPRSSTADRKFYRKYLAGQIISPVMRKRKLGCLAIVRIHIWLDSDYEDRKG